ncbi:MAG: hypothetical protein JWQ97_1857 [Phenylobacterium sp.]|nr:hypothetical protein [Phenylobacterium sp.]
MNLLDLAAWAPHAGPLRVPDWTLGCFHRRCITYASGAEDAATRVIWIQSHGLTGDIRVPAGRPDVSHRAGLADCTREELEALAHAEGGVADTAFDAGRMSWSNWAAFQPYDKWPEPGELRRVGTSLLEFAPSGIYVEDWRLQAGISGPLVGLRLVSEDGRPRDGGLVIAGEHALFALGRKVALDSEAPLPLQVRRAADPAALASRIFEAEARYARRSGDAFVVELATNPFLEGAPLDLEGFAPGPEPGLLRQAAGGVERLWRIDTLLADRSVPLSTPAEPEGLAWLEREGSRLPGVLG